MSVRRVRPGIAAGRLRAPPSKSYTHRAVLAAHFVGHRYRIEDPLVADDTLATLRAVRALGTAGTRRRGRWELAPGAVPKLQRVIDCGESGTTLRFLLPAAARLSSPVRFALGPGLRRRPLAHGLAALRAAGARVTGDGRPPKFLDVRGPIHPLHGTVDASESSQFLSGLLYALPGLPSSSVLSRVGSIVSEPYLEATVRMLAAHGVTVHRHGRRFEVPAPQEFSGARFRVPGDASSAAYHWAAAAATGGSVTVEGISAEWPQADLAILTALANAGVEVRRRARSVTVSGRPQRPLRADLDGSPDLLPLLGVLAATTVGTSRLRGAAHAGAKESNRRRETAKLARAMGAHVSTGPAVVAITGTDRPSSFSYDGAGDHRMVMSAAVGALVGKSASRIGSAETVRKSYPEFWSDFHQLTGAAEGGR
ncbi:MAG: 3-phosphoshikimate 1-carboxyvinyltransferase [Thermoplasmata archaeon]|nr:3-phosphoshikimate 1-carboxyvinyltransferase [Thermoplasmata archaeon]